MVRRNEDVSIFGGTLPGPVVGRTLLYPSDGDVVRAVDAVAGCWPLPPPECRIVGLTGEPLQRYRQNS